MVDGRRYALSSCRESLGVGRPLRPVAFVSAPQVDVAEAERTPPGVQHLPVEAQDAFAGNVFGRRSEPGEAVIETGAIGIAHAREQVPKCERVVLARVSQKDTEQGVAFRRGVRFKVEARQSVAKRCGSIFHVRGARAGFRTCPAK